MISVLSAVVLMLAIGTVIQRADLVSDYFGSSENDIALNTDLVDAQANRLLRVDVFENDTGVVARDRDRLTVIGQPSCGQVFVQAQALQYLPDASCIGQNIIEYGIEGRDGPVGQVIAQVNGAGELRTAAASSAPVEAAPNVPQAEQPEAPQPTQPERAASAPARSVEPSPTASTPEDTQAPAQVADVVDTLIQGAAQTANAASEIVEGQHRAATAEPQPSQAGIALELTEPSVERTLAQPLASVDAASSQEVSDQSNINTSPSTDAVQRASRAPALTPSTQPAPASAERPQIALRSPALEIVQPREQRAIGQADEVDLAAVTGAEAAPTRGLPEAEGTAARAQAQSDFLVAIVERREPNTQPPSAPRVSPGGDLALQRAPGATLPPRVEGAEDRIARINPITSFASPDANILAALPSSPVDPDQGLPQQNSVLTSTPPPLKPRARARDGGTSVEAPQGLSDTDAPRNTVPKSPTEPSAEQLAALPRHDAPCVIPPAMTIDVRRAARSIISVDAPCHADTVAELQYSGLRVALPLDRTGKGALKVLGFEPNAPALLTFINGEKIDFDLPFKGIGRVSRVAVVWDLPVALELNALEFGAEPGSRNHVRPDNPRDFQDVRRSGGGFLDTYRSHSGVGQNAQIYSYWHRRGGQHGAVELMIDYASRNKDRLEGTCGDGKYAAPNFLVLRSKDARLDRPVIRKLAPLDCSRVVEEKGDKRLISGAVRDLLVVEK